MTWDVIRVSKNRNADGLIDEVKRVNPEVVILREDRVGENSTLPLRLINEQCCLKVISVGLESNLLQVYFCPLLKQIIFRMYTRRGGVTVR